MTKSSSFAHTHCLQPLLNATHIHVGMQHATGTAFFYPFSLHILPPPYVTGAVSFVVGCCRMPKSHESQCFRWGDSLPHMPQLFAGASERKVEHWDWMCVPQSTPVVELGCVWVVLPKQRGRKAHLHSSQGDTAYVAHYCQKFRPLFFSAWKLSRCHFYILSVKWNPKGTLVQEHMWP